MRQRRMLIAQTLSASALCGRQWDGLKEGREERREARRRLACFPLSLPLSFHLPSRRRASLAPAGRLHTVRSGAKRRSDAATMGTAAASRVAACGGHDNGVRREQWKELSVRGRQCYEWISTSA